MLKSVLPALALLAVTQPAAGAEPAFSPIYESRAPLTPECKIDQIVFARLKALKIQPANLSSDAVFLRRAFLDVIGTLPTPQEATQFLSDKSPNKLEALIDALLDRPEFADYWAMKWSDILRVKAEFPINLWPNAAQAYYQWIRASVRENKPYDRFVRELLTESGSNFRVAPVNFYRAVQSKEPATIAQTVALTLMGARAEKWPKERLAGMAAFFSQIGYKETGEWKEEIVFFDPSKTAAKGDAKANSKPAAATAVFPEGPAVKLTGERDPREIFADWLTSPKNSWFARAIVNRAWYWLLGRGIVHEPDDIRPDNPAANPELLQHLEREFIASWYDMKKLFRLILTSKTYQLSSIPRSRHPEAERNFAWYPLRRLEAEVLADALCQVTGTSEKYSSAIPEPFTFIPDGQRSISLPDGSISSSFLELFGKPPRDTGLESERNNRVTAAQRLHMLNSSHVQRKLEQSPKLNFIMRNVKEPQKVLAGIYLLVLSRLPAPEEVKSIAAYSQGGPAKGRDALIDLTWALMNSAEFLYRH